MPAYATGETVTVSGTAIASPPSQTNNPSGDPNLDANYLPQSGSPVIDAADAITTWPSYYGGDLTLDRTTAPEWFAGQFTAPPSGAGYDVGAFELGVQASSNNTLTRGGKGMNGRMR